MVRQLLIGKTVKVENSSLLSFMFPGFELKESINMKDIDKDIIYVGKMKPNLLKSLQVGTRNFINTVGKPDVDLCIRSDLINLAFERHARKPTKAILESLETLDPEEFEYCFKIAWTAGRRRLS